MKREIKISLLLLFVFICKSSFAEKTIDSTRVLITSPDNSYQVGFYQKEDTQKKRSLYYTVSYKNQSVIYESLLDIQLDNHLSEQAMALKVDKHSDWCENLVVKKINNYSVNDSWKPIYGESDEINNSYNGATIQLVKDDNAIYEMNIEIRVYNEGVGIRYFFPENSKGTYYNIIAENTEFSLPANTKAWFTGWAQGAYQLLPLNNWPQESERPLTLQLSNGLYACLAEAQLTDYARTKFSLSKTKINTIVTSMSGEAALVSPIATPWRVIMVADKPSDLIEHNNLLLNLNESNKIKDVSWIKPGKIMRVMTQTTNDAKVYIDFCAVHHLQYILFDWKWYGPAFTFESDATKVVAPLDMPGIVRYAKEKNIGVWLYVNQQALLAQSDSLFTVYKKWGIKGVKFGFVQVGSHRWTTWVEKAIQQAAANNIMINIHDDWRPTGEQRTWPNLMTAEGIRGNEEMPDATHNTILPFTRFIAGAADYTICYYDKRIKTTHAHQLALAAIYYSPIQTLFWYDKPALYNNEPEIEFWENIPTVWNETKVLQGKPGQFITTARRTGNDWFVGIITSNEARDMQLHFDFLQKGKSYVATVYEDDDNVTSKTKVKVSKLSIDASTVMSIKLKPSGGQAIWLKQKGN